MSDDGSDFEDEGARSDSDDDFESGSKKKASTSARAKKAKKEPAAAKPKVPSQAAPSTAVSSSAPAPSTAAPSNAAKAGGKGALVPLAPSGSDAVLDYVRQHNAPLNAQMVADKFRGTLSKGQAEKHLLELAKTSQIILKENGKSKIFYASQEGLQEMSAAETHELNTQLSQESLAKGQLSEEFNSLRAAISAGRKPKKTLQDWRSEEAQLREEVAKLKAEADSQQQAASAEPLSESQSKKIADEYTKLLKEYKKRRRVCLDLLDKLSEGMQMSPKQLIRDWALETDEDYDVNPSQFPPLPVPRVISRATR